MVSLYLARDLNGRIRTWPSGMQQLYGFSAEEGVGRRFHDLLTTVFPASLRQIEAQPALAREEVDRAQ
jgi:PAS domain-containing protein